MSVAPPDGFSKWNEAEWERWLRDHPWESAERICSRGDWSIFLYQVREHSLKGRKVLEPLLESLINERPLSAQDTEDLRDALDIAQDDLDRKPATELKKSTSIFASPEDIDAMIAAARARMGGQEPMLGEVWTEIFDAVGRVLDKAIEQKRGVYFGNV
jgi:hypothetical protein